MALQILKSTDTGAPSITQAVGSIETLLDACLVNGYGSKSPLGWLSYFRNTTTGKKYYQQGSGSTSRVLMIQDTANNPYCYTDNLAQIGLAHPISAGVEPTATIGLSTTFGIERPDNYWEIIGNATFFFLLTGRNNWGGQAGLRSIFACGDLLSYASSDAGKCILAVNGRASTGIKPYGQWAVPYYNLGINQPIQSFGAAIYMAGMPDSPGNIDTNLLSRSIACESATFNLLDYPGITRQIITTPLIIGHIAQAQNPPSLRGQIPGLKIPLHKISAFQPVPYSTINGSGQDSGRTYMVVYTADPAQLAADVPLLIETSDTWGL